MAKIVGIGNALVDVIVKLDNEDLLKQFALEKGGMEMIDNERKRTIHEHIKAMPQASATGGSTSNTIHGLARLGIEAGYIGKVSDDEPGRFFQEEMQRYHVTPHLLFSDIDTGIATTFMTPDAERTFATYLGAAATMTADELNPEIFKDYDYLYIEGYLIFNHELILKLCQIAKENNMKVAMDFGSYNLVEQQLDFLKDILKNYVDIIFANEEEAKAFTGKEGEEALEILSTYCPVAIVKLGAKGSIVKVNGKTTVIAPRKANCIDTNGAGDIYAAGFMYGLLKDYDIERCGEIATLLSSTIIETVGAKLTDEQWEKLLPEVL
ncbi:MAG: adenosine kinase [Bacteroidales bacterium]|nr:adenosine kinase [Bacteroidales bacterium]